MSCISEDIKKALENDTVIDITTVGRKSGKEHRIEIWFHTIDGRVYITGSPGTRDWYANLMATPDFTFHLKQSVKADLPAKARVITNKKEREEFFKRLTQKVTYFGNDIAPLVEGSPLVEVTFT